MNPKFQLTALFAACAIALVFAGCSRPFDVIFFNNQNEAVELHFENRKVELSSKSAVTLSYGNVVRGINFKNSKGSFAFAFQLLTRDHIRTFRKNKISRDVVTFQLESDGQLYIVHPDDVLPSAKLSKQPDSFPLRPQLANSTND
jgi:hypothetical protein